jgi:hypothetical protein
MKLSAGFLGLPHQYWMSADAVIAWHALCKPRTWGWLPVRDLFMKFSWYLVVMLIFAVWVPPGFAEKMVNPDMVAPQYRAAAEKRRAEQIKLFACNKKADQAKVLPRDRAAFVGQCLDQ